jgi:hypothetical protein
MLRVRQLLLLLGLLSLTACDGGLRVERMGDPCADERITLRVEVVDAGGAPVPGAMVTATHLETGRTFTSTTRERGVTTALGEEVGAGTVRVEATAGAKVSPPAEVTWTCDGCNCRPDPASVRLQLHP